MIYPLAAGWSMNPTPAFRAIHRTNIQLYIDNTSTKPCPSIVAGGMRPFPKDAMPSTRRYKPVRKPREAAGAKGYRRGGCATIRTENVFVGVDPDASRPAPPSPSYFLSR